MQTISSTAGHGGEVSYGRGACGFLKSAAWAWRHPLSRIALMLWGKIQLGSHGPPGSTHIQRQGQYHIHIAAMLVAEQVPLPRYRVRSRPLPHHASSSVLGHASRPGHCGGREIGAAVMSPWLGRMAYQKYCDLVCRS